MEVRWDDKALCDWLALRVGDIAEAEHALRVAEEEAADAVRTARERAREARTRFEKELTGSPIVAQQLNNLIARITS